MTVWVDLLTALPAGASEAVATAGIAKLLQRFHRDLGRDHPITQDLEAVKRDDPIDLSRLVEALSSASMEDGNFKLEMKGEHASAQQIGHNAGLIIQNLSVVNPTPPSGP